jgi:eukaryotic-like serine/threonine-protein kinase
VPTSAIPDSVSAAFVGRYTLERQLGCGAIATVYLARDPKHDRMVALKVLRSELAGTIGPDRFLREIRATARLQHPRILPVFDSGSAGGQLWYAMPYIEGESLRDRMERERQLPLEEALRISCEVAEAIAYAHQRGVIHRDLRPENILLSGSRGAADGREPSGRVHALVADFGVAQAVDDAGNGQPAEKGSPVGSPAYMSPEQADGVAALDGRTDQYSLGCMLYEMLAGAPPWTGPTPQALIARRLFETPSPLRLLRAAVPAELEAAVARALAREPADRFPSTDEFAQALAQLLPAAPVTEPSFPPVDAARTRRSALWSRALLGLITLVAIALVATAVLRQRSAMAAPLDGDLLAVAPFNVLDPGLGLWREGLVDVLARKFDGAGPLRTVSPPVIIRRWRGGWADQASAAALGRSTGAKLAVYGSVVRSGTDSVRLTARVLDVSRERALGEHEVRGAVDQMDRLTDSLALGLVRQLGRTRPVTAGPQPGLGTRSLPALKAFLQAEQHYRRGAWDSARVYGEQAVALDSTFALAYRLLGNAIGWQLGATDAMANEYKERAGALNHGLPPRDSLLVLADSLFQDPYPISETGMVASPAWGARIFAVLEETVRRYPGDPEAWNMLGEARYHLGVWLVPTGGWRATLEAFERSVTLDSLFAPAYIHLVETSYALSDTARGRRFATALIRLNPGSAQAHALRAVLRLLALPNSAAQARLLDSLPREALGIAYGALARWPDSAELAVRIARHRVRATHSQEDLPEARIHLAYALAFRGHLREALTLVGDAPSDLMSNDAFAEAALLGYVPAERARATFDRWLRLGDWPPFLPVPALALPWWGAQRDTVSLRRFMHVVDTMTGGPRSPGALSTDRSARAALLVTAARAQDALVRGDTAAALRAYAPLLGAAAPCAPWCQVDRLLAARLLDARGQLAEAARVLNSPPSIEGGTTALSPGPRPSDVLWYLERGHVAERLGERARALEAYRFVADAWRHPDPELEPYAADARAGLARFTAEPTR